MAHYAKVLDGKVLKVIVAEPDFFDTFVDDSPGFWIQTSYNTRGGIHYGKDGYPDDGVALRGNYASIGFTYDAENDVFYPPRPKDIAGLVCESWTISAPTWAWKPPIPYIFDDTTHAWNEETKSWVLRNTVAP